MDSLVVHGLIGRLTPVLRLRLTLTAYRPRKALLSPKQAFLCASKSPPENRSFGGAGGSGAKSLNARPAAVTPRIAVLPSAQDLFKGRHFDRDVIILCVRWYLTFKLSARDLVQMTAERGIALAHTTILRRVQRYVPEFEKRWRRYALPVGDSWRAWTRCT